jgi:hypothetical protein
MERYSILPIGITLLKNCFFGKGEVKGYKFTQIQKSDIAFIYEVTSSRRKHYEVFKKKVNNRYNCISYPKSKSFGIWAWTCMTLEVAIAKVNELNSCD